MWPCSRRWEIRIKGHNCGHLRFMLIFVLFCPFRLNYWTSVGSDLELSHCIILHVVRGDWKEAACLPWPMMVKKRVLVIEWMSCCCIVRCNTSLRPWIHLDGGRIGPVRPNRLVMSCPTVFSCLEICILPTALDLPAAGYYLQNNYKISMLIEDYRRLWLMG